MGSQPKRTSSESHLDLWDKRDLAILSVLCCVVALIVGIMAWYFLKGVDKGEKIIKEVEPEDVIKVIPNIDDTNEGAIP